MWVTRDKNGYGGVRLWKVKPKRGNSYWKTDYSRDDSFTIDEAMFPDLKWEDEPVEVVIDNLDNLILKFEILNTQFQGSSESVGHTFEDFAKKHWNDVDLNYFDSLY